MINHTTATVYARCLAPHSLDAIADDSVLSEWYEALVDWAEEESDAHETRVEMIRRQWPAFTY